MKTLNSAALRRQIDHLQGRLLRTLSRPNSLRLRKRKNVAAAPPTTTTCNNSPRNTTLRLLLHNYSDNNTNDYTTHARTTTTSLPYLPVQQQATILIM